MVTVITVACWLMPCYTTIFDNRSILQYAIHVFTYIFHGKQVERQEIDYVPISISRVKRALSHVVHSVPLRTFPQSQICPVQHGIKYLSMCIVHSMEQFQI